MYVFKRAPGALFAHSTLRFNVWSLPGLIGYIYKIEADRARGAAASERASTFLYTQWNRQPSSRTPFHMRFCLSTVGMLSLSRQCSYTRMCSHTAAHCHHLMLACDFRNVQNVENAQHLTSVINAWNSLPGFIPCEAQPNIRFVSFLFCYSAHPPYNSLCWPGSRLNDG